MVRAFEFEDNGLTFTCSVEKPRAGHVESWWWFGVAGDGNRYAPFQAGAADTQESVRMRIVTYYTDRLARRAMPAVVRQHWASRGKGVVATSTVPATPATPAGRSSVNRVDPSALPSLSADGVQSPRAPA